MRKIITGIILLSLLTMNLFAGTAIYKQKKADGTEQRTVFDSNEKIATFITFMNGVGSPVEKVIIQTKGSGTFADASAEKPYYCIKFKNAKGIKMFMWKSDFDEVIAEMKGEKK